MLPTPSDLPVFYHIAMKVLGRQNLQNANDIIIVPDNPRKDFRDMVVQDSSRPLKIPIILAEHTWLKRAIARVYNRPNHFHWAQIVCGVEHSGSIHALLHDADMFLLDENFLEDHYAHILQKNLKVLGISPAWDPWFSQNGYKHLTATWEMLVSVEWIRSFPPALLHGHTNRLRDQTHTFDTSYYVQCLTEPHSIAHRECNAEFIHFNWLISSYRWYVRSRDNYCDERFVIMLLRLLIDEFDPDYSYPHIPSWEKIACQLSDRRGPLFYPSSETHRTAYMKTRTKIGSLFNSPLVKRTSREIINMRLRNFDKHYNYIPHGDD